MTVCCSPFNIFITHYFSSLTSRILSWSQLHCIWATVCTTVRPMLSDRSLSVCLSVCPVLSCPFCPVCNVGALWPNGLTDQDETWHAGRPQPWPHCIRWGPSSPSPKGAQPPQFSAHIRCGQMAAEIKMPLGMEVALGPGDVVLDGDPAAPPHKRGRSLPPNFFCSRPMFILRSCSHKDSGLGY